MTAKQNRTRKIHANELHAKLVHCGEYRISATAKHLKYSVMGVIQVCKDCAAAKNKHELLHKVVEERNLKTGEMIYLDPSSQKKPSCGGSKNWILLQDSDTKEDIPSS